MRLGQALGLAAVALGLGLPRLANGEEAKAMYWESHIRPLFKQHCLKCHGGAKQKGGLDLRSLGSTLMGGDSGSPVMPGNPEGSLIYKVLLPEADPHMPPGEGTQLPESDLSLVKNWVVAHVSPHSSHTGSNTWATASPVAKPSPLKLPPAGLSASRVIDDLVRAGWQNKGVIPARRSSDRVFVRRVYLDLVGRIPMSAERAAFLEDDRLRKREALVDSLLTHPEFASHMREMFDVLLLGRMDDGKTKRRADNSWHAYLETVFRENRPWNEFVRDIILARTEESSKRGASWFLYEQNNDHQKMAESIAPVAFGVDVQCAQCHDHPSAPEIKQAHYWGLVASFNRSKNIDTQNGPGLTESAIGGFISYKNLAKVSAPAELTFLNGKSVPEQRPARDSKEKDDPAKYVVPPDNKVAAKPKFSRREVLASAALTDNPRLAKAFVNRVWAMLIGRGIVHPVGEMNSEHPPSHPELLGWLAREFEQSGFDIKKLIRDVVLSEVYQLDSKPVGQARPEPAVFAVALEKPLHAEVLFRSLLVATCRWPSAANSKGDVKAMRRLLLAQFPDLFPREYNASIQQAMFLSNNPIVRDIFHPNRDVQGLNLPSLLLNLPGQAERVSMAFETVFGRPPTRDEAVMFEGYLTKRSNRLAKGIEQMLWAMVCSPEFLMNH
jgi:hypothetical protein